jgi:UPF0716 protein FxsA
MGLLILLLLIAVPLIEIAVFIEIGGQIGVGATIVATVLTAMAGTWLLRAQGLATLARARGQMDQGILPARELFDGLCLLFAGALLLVPGFVTDAVGLILFIPAVRERLRRFIGHRIEAAEGARRGPGRPGHPPSDVIDADYRDVTEDDQPDHDNHPRIPR